jgi:hypothetical protein
MKTDKDEALARPCLLLKKCKYLPGFLVVNPQKTSAQIEFQLYPI